MPANEREQSGSEYLITLAKSGGKLNHKANRLSADSENRGNVRNYTGVRLHWLFP